MLSKSTRYFHVNQMRNNEGVAATGQIASEGIPQILSLPRRHFLSAAQWEMSVTGELEVASSRVLAVAAL